MIGLILLVVVGVIVGWLLQRFERLKQQDVTSPKTSARLKKLWDYVGKAFNEQRYWAAERALLSILRIDHKNTAAYNRLGMLYARQQNYEDAIECFDIASSLTPTVSTLYNLGLVQYEYGNFEKAATAFEKVIDLEPSSKRYMAYAKALEQIGNHKKVVEILEKVRELEPTQQHLELLAQAYERVKDFAQAEEVRQDAAITRAKKKEPRPAWLKK